MDPLDLTRKLNAENLALRGLLEADAQELERIASEDPGQGAHAERAARIPPDSPLWSCDGALEPTKVGSSRSG